MSDLFTLVFTLTVMLALSWKVTLLSLVVIPGFALLDRRLARVWPRCPDAGWRSTPTCLRR